ERQAADCLVDVAQGVGPLVAVGVGVRCGSHPDRVEDNQDDPWVERGLDRRKRQRFFCAQEMQRRAVGTASRRSGAISLPQRSHWPYEPRSTRPRADWTSCRCLIRPSTNESTLARSEVACAASAKPSSRETWMEPSAAAPSSASSFSISISSDSRRCRDWASTLSLNGTGSSLVARRSTEQQVVLHPPPGEAFSKMSIVRKHT